MKAVMYGAGNIGRGFIGALFSKSGYDVTFIDISKETVSALNSRGRYPLRYVSSDGATDEWITNVSAVDGADTEAVARAIADADILATSVGARVLEYIAPNIANGIKLRGGRPLDILICENLMNANSVLKDLLLCHLDEKTLDTVGLVETSIGRMVPIQTDAMKDGEPLRVCVEKYGFLPVDRDAFKGEIPDIKGIVAVSPFDFYIKRKLYLHNMGHAVCAYLGAYSKKTYIHDAIADPDIYITVQSAMTDSAAALCKKYEKPLDEVLSHISDLLYRFKNSALCDTCARVGGDPVRKLSQSDRLIGAALTCLETGITPAWAAVGAAGAVYFRLNELSALQTEQNALDVLLETTGLETEHPLIPLILEVYAHFKNGDSIAVIRNTAEDIRHRFADDIM